MNKEIDWEERKFFLVKDIFCSAMIGAKSSSYENLRAWSIKQADKLIEELRKDESRELQD